MFETLGGTHATFLREHGHEVIEPSLPAYRFGESVAIAQKAIDEHVPEVVVGYSRGGAVAMNLRAGPVPLVLIAPAWNWQVGANSVEKGTVILHSQSDRTVPFEHTRQLAHHSELPPTDVIVVGSNHEMADPAALAALLEAVERVGQSWVAGQIPPHQHQPAKEGTT